MNYVIQAKLKNPRRPECEQITIPFPIPIDQYDKTIEMLQATGMGFAVDRDCFVDELESRYHVLGVITNTLVNIDQLDYLAKRLNGFRAEEVSQFEAMAHKLNINNVQDLINLTFCCQQVTVITDFSNLEAVGRNHFMNLNRGTTMMKELENLDGTETAWLLINTGEGVITPYGVVYDNGMELEQVYNGRQFPVYPYSSPTMVLEITQKLGLAEGKNLEYLYLPASKHQIERTLPVLASPHFAMPRFSLTLTYCPKTWRTHWSWTT